MYVDKLLTVLLSVLYLTLLQTETATAQGTVSNEALDEDCMIVV